MSWRRGTRSRRGGRTSTSYPPVSNFYASGIKLHFDAALGVTSAASRVSQWNDQTGNGNHLVQGVGANQPLLVAGATPAGTPGILLDSVARQLTKLTLTTTQANASLTLFLVVKVPVAAAGRCYYHGNGAGTQGINYAPAGSNRVLNSLGSTALTGGAHSQVNFEVICWRLSASGGYGTAITTKEIYVNGVLGAAPTGTPNMSQGTDTLILGSSGSSAAVTYAEIAEAPDVLLSSADCVAISLGLKAKHGIV